MHKVGTQPHNVGYYDIIVGQIWDNKINYKLRSTWHTSRYGLTIKWRKIRIGFDSLQLHKFESSPSCSMRVGLLLY